MDTIYQEIWDADQRGNGVPALRPEEPTDDKIGYVVVDEPAAAADPEHRVLQEVNIPEHKRRTYQLCQNLFDNYALLRGAGEDVKPEEVQEELDFIDAILDTPPIRVAQQHLSTSLGLDISQALLASMIKETWFDMGSAGNQRDASGFEHVFVGEQASQASHVGGYHFWYKYHLDDGGRIFGPADGDDRIIYHGERYGGGQVSDQGILVPEVVTLSLTWQAPDRDGAGGEKRLTKPIGGFFVGCSPEGLIALGLVRCRTQSSKIANINGAEYQLDLHRLDGRPNAIRTFFPRFRRADVVRIDPPTPGPSGDEPENPQPSGDAPFRIVAAMVNPVNPEGGREFVQIINVSNHNASLKDWRIVAPNGVAFTLDDIQVRPGDLFKFHFPTAQGALRNRAGDIRFFDAQRNLAQTCSYTGEQASQEGAPVMF